MAAHYDVHDKNRIFYIDTVKQLIEPDDAVDLLIEESAKLIQALCEWKRAVNGTNPTPVTREEAISNAEEALGDVLNAVDVLGLEPGRLQQEEEMLRLAQRLLKAQEKNHGRDTAMED